MISGASLRFRQFFFLIAFASPLQAAPLDELLDALLEQTGVPGISVAVSRQGVTLWRGEAGFADLEIDKPVAADTIFRLASVSKAVCSVIAAKLVETEVLAVDTRVGALLPELPEQYHPLTLRDLMTHTSGLPHYEARDFGRGRDHYESAVAGLEQLGDRALLSRPGSDYLYSTHGFSLASAMMERAADRTFIELFDESVARGTMALESTRHRSVRRTAIYEVSRNGGARNIEREDFSYSWCGAGMESSAVDVSLFASTLFGEHGVLGEAGQQLLAAPMPDRNGNIVTAERWSMTLGWRRSQDVRGDTFLHHAGVTNGARSILAVWPETGLAVALLSNASWSGRMEDTAVAFALAAQADESLADKSSADCPDPGRYEYSGRSRDAAIEGTITWQHSAAACAALLAGDNELTAWFSRFNYGVVDEQPLIWLGNSRWGLVSSIGVSILSRNGMRLEGLVASGSLRLEYSR